jgi:YVTN family beta-propeller protein
MRARNVLGTFLIAATAWLVVLPSPALAAAGISAGKATYARGEPIQIAFSGGPGNARDWVGIYRQGQVPGQVSSTLWYYVGGSKAPGAAIAAGTLSFADGSGGWPLGAGAWSVFFLENDGYTVLASTGFTVSRGVQSVLSTSKTIYAPGEPIVATFTEGPGHPTDWVGIYPDGVTPGTAGSTLWAYVGGGKTAGAPLASGTLTFGAVSGTGPLPPGRWKAFLLADDGYSMLAYATFWVGREDATALTPGGWLIAPAGRQSVVGSGPLAIARTPDGAHLVVANGGYDHHSLMLVDAHTGQVLQTLAGIPDAEGSLYVGLVISSDGKRVFASDGTNDAIRTFTLGRGKLVEGEPIYLPAGTWPAGLALTEDGRRLVVAGNLSDQVLLVDLAASEVSATGAVGHLPYGVAISRDGKRVFVSNWGANTVSVVDSGSGKLQAAIEVGMHPSAILASPARDEIYVADTDSDEITVIDGRTSKVLRTVSLRPWPGAPAGASPNALALSPDGRTLYVANAGDNDVAVVRLADHEDARRGRGDRVQGLIPTGWFPSGVVLDPSGRTLHVLNMKGLGVGPVQPGAYIADQLVGTLSRIEVPDGERLDAFTGRVQRNDRFPGQEPEREDELAGRIIPRLVGDPSPIRHVIYVMKENRTYDQVFGDLDRGNGDPTLAIFGERVTPNHHELARRFVTFDNFYCEGEVSADGWIWSNAASANTYNQKNWPLDYGWAGRLYDFGGFGNDETAGFPGPDPRHSFLWDRLAARGISYRNYGFFLNGLGGSPPTQQLPASIPGLEGHTDLLYSGWDLDLPDVERLKEWLREFQEFEAKGAMPTVQFVYLPRDHTVGTATGASSPTAMVADNDLALGQLVEAVSHSRFWSDTAIFVVEDDAQDGPDHVDGHRTVALVISPYTQTGKVDSTRYSTVSMLRTMELIVGVEPLTQYDALARPMTRAFTDRPEFRPYDVRTPAVSRNEANLPGAPMARQSNRMDFSRPDAASRRVLNEAIWQSVRGKGNRMPEPRTAVAIRE